MKYGWAEVGMKVVINNYIPGMQGLKGKIDNIDGAYIYVSYTLKNHGIIRIVELYLNEIIPRGKKATLKYLKYNKIHEKI